MEEAMVSWDEAFKRFKAFDVSKMNLQQWLNMWGKLCHKSAGISDFPIWVQILPHILFKLMDKDSNKHKNPSLLRHLATLRSCVDKDKHFSILGSFLFS